MASSTDIEKQKFIAVQAPIDTSIDDDGPFSCLPSISLSTIFTMIELIALGLAAYYVYVYVAQPIMTGINDIKAVIAIIESDVKKAVSDIENVGSSVGTVFGL